MALLTDRQIINLIGKAINRRSETQNIEFKDARGGFPRSSWKSISSLSHRPGGGLIVYGVNEDRSSGIIEVVGIANPAEMQERIASYLRDVMQNHGSPDIRLIHFQKQNLVILILSETPDEQKPCFNKQLGLPRGACIRDGNSDRIITDDEMRNFIRNSTVYKYDKAYAKGIEIGDLDKNKIQQFLIKSAERTGRSSLSNNPTHELMKNVGILDNFEGELKPTVAGFLTFAHDLPQFKRDFSRYEIRCVRYKGNSAASPILDKRDIQGTLDKQIDDVLKFILLNIPLSAKILKAKRVEQYEYPPEAIRELVANAVIHRDYMITETYTQVRVFSNRLEISNPGNLPPGVTVKNIKDSQFSRNEIIAAILKDLDYLEEYGRGIDIVFSKMEEYGLQIPIFENISNCFRVILLGRNCSDLNERQVKIWNTAKVKHTITAKESERLYTQVSRATINNDLKRLVTAGLLTSRGSSSNIYYESVI